MIYNCQNCKNKCSVIRLSENKTWECDKCYFKKMKNENRNNENKRHKTISTKR